MLIPVVLLLVLVGLPARCAAVSDAESSDQPTGAEFEPEAPESYLRRAALGSLEATAEAASKAGLREYWTSYDPRDILDPEAATTPEAAIQSVWAQLDQSASNSFQLEEYQGAWTRWYRLLGDLTRTAHPSYVAAAISLTPGTHAACAPRSQLNIEQWAPGIRPPELRKIFYQATALLAAMEPAERFSALAGIASALAEICENGWMIR